MKRSIAAAVLSLILTLSLIPALTTAVWADDDYPYSGRDNGVDEIDPWRFYYGGCTSFVAWRLNHSNGIEFDNFYGGVQWGNAAEWASAARVLGIPVDSTPAVGSVYWQDAYVHQASGSGHVAWVKEIHGGTVVIEQYASGSYSEMTVPASNASGYIHIHDIASAPATEPYTPPVAPSEPPTEQTEMTETEEPAELLVEPAVSVSLPKTADYREGQFEDISTEDWFEDDVAEAFAFGLMKGDSETTFNPYGNVTVAEAVTMAARLSRLYREGNDSFRAAGAGEPWYAPYADYAAEQGIIGRARAAEELEREGV